MNLSIPDVAPAMEQLKLVTMTVKSKIPANLNLDVIARHTELNDSILGISYRDIVRGKSKSGIVNNIIEDRSYFLTDSTSGKFKNQCTFIINVGSKNINTKIFNNGKIINVGCKKPEHAEITANIICKALQGMEGLVIYKIPDRIINNNVKKFFKDDLRKKFGELIQILVCELELDCNIEPFDNNICADESYKIFQEELTNTAWCSDIMYVYTIITILKCYYDEKELLDCYNNPEFQYILTMIINNTDREKGEISCIFPSYLNNKSLIEFNPETIEIELINKSTNCGFFINRVELVDLLSKQPNIIKCKYDKNRYPGVIAVHRTPSKDVKIISFNTGKINITSTRTYQQVQQAYEFISEFCRENFKRILLKSEYSNKIKEYENKLPIQHYVGVIDNQQYYLLKKSNIVSNPRNVRFLHVNNLLSRYQ